MEGAERSVSGAEAARLLVRARAPEVEDEGAGNDFEFFNFLSETGLNVEFLFLTIFYFQCFKGDTVICLFSSQVSR